MPQTNSSTSFSGIFVSYRREDSSGHAGRLFDCLVDHFGRERIFMDIDTIEPGEDFVAVIENAVASCDILIAVIGRSWLAGNKSTGRLNDPNDFVRVEIATALERDIRVIPVLVQNASMPMPSDLPDNLTKLARRNAIELRDLRWQNDVEELINVMDRLLNEREKARLAKAASEAEAKRQAETEEERRRLEEEKQRVLAEMAAKQKAAVKAVQEAEERKRQQVKVNEDKQRAIEAARLEAQERVALLEKRTAEEHDRQQESTLNDRQIESDSADFVRGVEPFHSPGKSGSNGVTSSVAMSHSTSDSTVVAPQLSGATASRSAVAATTAQSRKYKTLAFISLAVVILIVGGVSIRLIKSRWFTNPQVNHEQPLKVAPSHATASSKRPSFRTFTYEAANAVDGRLDTAWIEGVDDAGVGEWISFDFGQEVILHRITIHPGYFKDETVWKENNRLAVVTLHLSDGSSRDLSFLNEMKSVSTSVGPVKIRWVRLAITKIYDGSKPGPHNDTALSEVVFECEPTDTRN